MALIIDASVALKWVLEEADAVQARELLQRGDLQAPDFLIIECASTLSRQVRRKAMDCRRATNALEEIRGAQVRLSSAMRLLDPAQRLALELNAATYDCLYLALAVAEQATLVTADARFLNAAAAHPAYAGHVRAL